MPETHSLTELATGLAEGTRVMTIEGPRPVERLAAGDRLVTRQGVRRLRELKERSGAAPGAITICASALGHGRPEADLTVGPDQTVTLRGWRADALFGAACAELPARRLVDGAHVKFTAAGPLRMFDLVFETGQTVYAEGIEMRTTLMRGGIAER